MKLYHVTGMDRPLQAELIPSIPEEMMANEESKTKRISLSDTVLGCLRGLNITNDEEKNELNIRVYSVEIDSNDSKLISWDKLYNEGYVDDAVLTHEYWYTGKLVPNKVDIYRIFNFKHKYYKIIRSKYKNELIKMIKNQNVYTGDISDYSAFHLINEWLPKQDAKITDIINKGMQHKCRDLDEVDNELFEIIFREKPIKNDSDKDSDHDENCALERDYDEYRYLESFDQEIIDLNYKFIKSNHEEMIEYKNKFDLVLFWEMIDNEYIWKKDYCLYKILDSNQNIVAFIYFSIVSDDYKIVLFEVVSKYQSQGIGKDIINQFMVEQNVTTENIHIDYPLLSEAKIFWEKCGITNF